MSNQPVCEDRDAPQIHPRNRFSLFQFMSHYIQLHTRYIIPGDSYFTLSTLCRVVIRAEMTYTQAGNVTVHVDSGPFFK